MLTGPLLLEGRMPPDAATPARRITCPYHAWSYRLDGSLRGAPGFGAVPGFDHAEHSLVRLPLEVWHGFVMVNGSGDAPPLAEHVGALGDLVGPYRPERLVAMASREYLRAYLREAPAAVP